MCAAGGGWRGRRYNRAGIYNLFGIFPQWSEWSQWTHIHTGNFPKHRKKCKQVLCCISPMDFSRPFFCKTTAAAVLVPVHRQGVPSERVHNMPSLAAAAMRRAAAAIGRQFKSGRGQSFLDRIFCSIVSHGRVAFTQFTTTVRGQSFLKF